MRKFFLLCAMAVLGFGQANAQLDEDEYGFFNHVALGVSAGTDGIGFQVAAPLGQCLALRAGYSFFPKLKYNKEINLGNDVAFVKSKVDLEGKLNFNQVSVLVDYYPFTSSSFRVTAGAYFGDGKILTVSNAEPFIKEAYWETAGIQLGKGNAVSDKYTVVSDAQGNVNIDLKVNSFRPYLGIGFGRAVPRKRVGLSFDLGVQIWGSPEVQTNLMYFDGNKGDFVTRYEKVNKNRITRDDKDDYKDIRDAIKTIEKVGVYPVLTLRLNGRLF